MATPCKQILLVKYSSEELSDENFEVSEGEIEAIQAGSGDVLIKNVLLSLDPWNRLCMHSTNQGLYFPPFSIGKPVPVLSVSRVISSDNADYKAGDFLTCLATASEYSLIRGGKDGAGFPLKKIDPNVPLENYLSFLGLPGFTAWIGIVRIGEAKSGEQVFVSAASGGVGLAAGQIAKMRGCRVVGSVSTDEKVRFLKEEFGFDDAFNYKKEKDWNATLARMFPNGIDIYFENVGGKMLEAALNHLNLHARIPISGMISQYNKDWKLADGVRNLMNLVGRCAKMEGFLAYDHITHYDEFVSEMLPLVAESKIVSKHTITKGIENFPLAFIGMMRGENIGKALVDP
ncbi:NADPH-dependent oxidoreductase 2-alkenal reductase [Selaginella moellendorffii]|uniref:NADPH-dependent oxidoreductase 2-alkenal reductase n=1 Tax=Selaginella moellendorffii TaxID=88036 RepID=UPI000D1CC20B|nr:NADPH-dependent oxidoreductase 2-alkenal reductase [Selaginella moellendorffii]|eukprot:XP_024533221.1 NADPH-dependent oxidoreductase 2-alkenal reductase [Selaginella moellendorffii]